MIYQHLFDRVDEPGTVRAGLIGVGRFGTPIVTQASIVPRLEVPVVADIDIEAGRLAYRQAGIAEEDIVVCESRSGALRALEAGKRVVLQDALLMMDLPLDVIATATLVPESGSRYAREAISHGKHVVMIDKEADSVVGPILKHLADRAGVVFTTDDGDQPGLLMGLVSWARALGLEVLCGGQLRSCLYDPASATVAGRGDTVYVQQEDQWALERIPGGEASRYAEMRRRLFADWRPEEECGDPICTWPSRRMAQACCRTSLWGIGRWCATLSCPRFSARSRTAAFSRRAVLWTCLLSCTEPMRPTVAGGCSLSWPTTTPSPVW